MGNPDVKFDNGDLVNAIDQMIIDNLSEGLVVDQLSERVGLSKFHLHRMFAAQTGFELVEYMQRRKMERALALLEQGKLSVIEVALEVGYESHSSFSRVFKQSFSVSPSQVVKGKPCEPLVKYKKKPKQELATLETRWHYFPATKVFGSYCRGFEQNSFVKVANTAFSRLTDLSQHGDYISSNPIGVAITNPWSTEHEKAEFFCGLLSGLAPDSSLEEFEIPEGNYISAIYTGPYHQLWQFISKLHSYWTEQNQITLACRQVIQKYLNDPTTTAPENLKTELFFAVEQINADE